jgi:DNA-binding transcriptional LysR family regulator
MQESLALPLLPVFEVLVAERSVSRAAERLHVSQPAISRALGKLRAHFGDPLFIRTAKGMEPTPRALEIADGVTPALQQLRDATVPRSSLNHRTTKRTLRISMSDYESLVLLPKVFGRIADEAPGLKLAVVRTVTERARKALSSGEIDLFVGQQRAGTSPFFSQELFAEPFACLVRHDHPFACRAPTLGRYCAARHILIFPGGTGEMRGMVDRALQKMDRTRSVVLSLPHFLAAPHIMKAGDAVLTLPLGAALIYEKLLRLKRFHPPLRIERYSVAMLWHQRQHADPVAQWLRSAIADSATSESRSTGPT